MNSSLLYIGASGYRSSNSNSFPAWVILVVFLIPIVISVTYYVVKSRKVSQKLLVTYKKLIDLAICVTQSDNNISEKDIKKVYKHIDFNFDKRNAAKLKEYFKSSVHKKINLKNTLSGLSTKEISYVKNMNFNRNNLEIAYFTFLVQLSISDRFLSKKELEILQTIKIYWKINEKKFHSILAMFNYTSEEDVHKQKSYRKATTNKEQKSSKLKQAYAILELHERATLKEVKTNYRRLVMTYHPDKVKGVNEVEKKQARQMFLKVQKAYEYIQTQKKF